MTKQNNTHRVAAVQIQARLADVQYNLAHVKELALEAIAQGAKVISLPEFFTTSIVLDDRLWGCALPPENPALDMLIELATDNGVLIGGSYLELRDGDIYNCYTLVRPDGTVTRHDKDLPTMVENAFYVPGNTDGVHQTELGGVGTAVCWETIRSQTINRLAGKIEFAMTGTHWWSIANNWTFMRDQFEQLHVANRALFRQVPSNFAKYLGVANIHASHCGEVKGKFAWLPKRLWDVDVETSLLGETQIVDNQGNVLKRLSLEDGAGVIVADVDLTPTTPSLDTPNRFWLPDLPLTTRFSWSQQNAVCKGIYQSAKRDGLF
jgi:predicted amidohydrolase